MSKPRSVGRCLLIGLLVLFQNNFIFLCPGYYFLKSCNGSIWTDWKGFLTFVFTSLKPIKKHLPTVGLGQAWIN